MVSLSLSLSVLVSLIQTHTHTHNTQMFKAVFFYNHKTWKQPVCSFTNE